MPLTLHEQAPVPPPAYQRAQARPGRTLHIDALTLVTTLHLLMLTALRRRLIGARDLIRSPKRVLAYTWEECTL
jgi:hypothetical protein